MQEQLIEMRVGETLQLGAYQVTIVDIDGDQLCLRIDGSDDDPWTASMSPESDEMLQLA